MSLGTEVVEDCLSLLAHLLRFNISNQSSFRETGCVKRVTHLLHECQQEPEGDEPLPEWTLVHRDKNVWGLLAIIQLFLIRGSASTPINQTAFWQNGVTEQVLSIAFGQRFSVSVTAKVRCTSKSDRPVRISKTDSSRRCQLALISSVAIRLYKRDSVTSRSCGALIAAAMRLSMATAMSTNLYVSMSLRLS